MRRKISLAILVISLMALMSVGTNAMAATIGLRAVDTGLVNSSGVVEVPEIWYQFDIELFLALDEDIAGNGIVGFMVDVKSDPLVRINSFAPGSMYTFMDSPISNGDLVEVDGYNFGPGIIDNHLLGILTLECMGPGVTELIAMGRLPEQRNVALTDGTFLPIEFGSLTINQVVPIPGAFYLLCSGLLGLIGIKKRMR